MALSSKAMRLMGFNRGKHPHQEVATRALNNNLCLLHDDYTSFWQELSDPKATSALVSALLEKVMAVELKGLDKIHKTLQPADLPTRFQHDDIAELFTISVCKTLYFIGLNYSIDQQCPEFITTMDKWNKHEKMEIAQKVDRILRMEIIMSGSRATPLAIDLSWFSAAELSTMNTNVTMTRGRKVSSVSSNSREEELSTILTAFNEFPFATLYARRMLHSGHAKALFDASLKLMTNLPQRLKMGTATTVRSMSALMLMLTQILTEHPIADTTALRCRLLPPLEVFCSWPVPFGQLARNMRHMIEGEIRAPGTLFRKMLFEEQPLLSLAGINKMKSKTHSVKRVKQHTVWAELQHSVFVYYDMSDKRALHLRHILMNNKSKEEEENEQMHEQHQQNQSAASRSEDGNGNGDELMMKTEKIRHEIRKRCLLNMLESSIDLVHDLTSTNYTAKEKRIVLESGGWYLPFTKKISNEKKAKEKKQKHEKKSSKSSTTTTSGTSSTLSKDPLSLNDYDPALIADWYRRALIIYDDAAMDTTLPLTAYSQLRASKLIELVKEMNPTIIAIPTASHSSHHLQINQDQKQQQPLKRVESDVNKALKTARSVGKAVHLFKRNRTPSPKNKPLQSSPPPPPSIGLGSNQLPLPVRNGFGVTHKLGLPSIQLEFQDEESALKPLQLKLYKGPFVHHMEHERPVDKPIKNSSTKTKENQRIILQKKEKVHKEAMETKYGHWKSRCVIGPTKRKYLKYPEARYNPLAPISGDLLVAALYAGSVDLSQKEEQSTPEQTIEREKGSNPSTNPSTNLATNLATNPSTNPSTKNNRHRRTSSIEMRIQEEQRTLQHLSTTRENHENKHTAAAAKEKSNVMNTHNIEKKSILRISVMGNDPMIHRILCNYVCFRHEYEKRFVKLSIRLYIIPTKRYNCNLASYLANHDAWYKRQIYAPFSTPCPIIPTMMEMNETQQSSSHRSRSTSSDKRTQKNKTEESIAFNNEINEELMKTPSWLKPSNYSTLTSPVPMEMYSDLMQDYIRTAKHVVPLCIFDCQCWEEKNINDSSNNNINTSSSTTNNSSTTSSATPDITIPFCMGCEIGIRARSELHKAIDFNGTYSSKSELNNCSCDSIIGCKDFRKTWSKDAGDVGGVDDITGTFTEVNPSGVPISKVKTLPSSTNGGSFYRIACRNIPLQADVVGSRGTNSHPSFSSIDLHVLPTVNNLSSSSSSSLCETLQKVSQSSKSVYRTSKRETNAVVHTMLSGGYRYQVNSIDIRSSGAPFCILLDGQCFGPFKRIKIVPCLSSQGEPVLIPISTFSPVV